MKLTKENKVSHYICVVKQPIINISSKISNKKFAYENLQVNARRWSTGFASRLSGTTCVSM